jgi:hypothetical protein
MALSTEIISRPDCILKQKGGRSFLVLRLVKEDEQICEVVMIELKSSEPIVRPWSEISRLIDEGELE